MAKPKIRRVGEYFFLCNSREGNYSDQDMVVRQEFLNENIKGASPTTDGAPILMFLTWINMQYAN